MSKNCAPFIANQFLYSYEAEFIQKILHEKKQYLAVAFNSIISIYRRRLINKNQFHSYVDLIYSNELEIEDATECFNCAFYLYILLKLDTHGKITTHLYEKRDDFSFSIVNFPHLCSKYSSFTCI
jgi:hypothetical protein